MMRIEDGIFIWNRFSVGWNFHPARLVRSFGLAVSFTPDSVLLLFGPITFVWLYDL